MREMRGTGFRFQVSGFRRKEPVAWRPRSGLRAPFLGALFLCSFSSLLLAEAPSKADAASRLSEREQRQIERTMALAMADPRSEHALGRLYAIYKRHSREYELLDLFRSAIEADRKNKNLHILLAQVYIEFRDYYMAEKKLTDAIKLDPRDYFPRYLLAEVLVRKGEHEKAAAQYENSIGLTSDVGDLVRSYESLGQLYAKQQLRDKAIEAWEQGLEHRKFDPEAHARVAVMCAEHGFYKEAQLRYEEILRIAKESPGTVCETQVALARLLERQEKLQPAIKAYRAALEMLDEDSHHSKEIDEAIFRCFEALDDTASLLAQLKAAVEKAPHDPVPLRRLATVQAKLGRPEDAVASLKTATELAPEDVSILEDLLAVHRGPGAFAELIPVYGKLISLNDENLSYLVGLGEAQLRLGREEEALTTWRKMVSEPDGRRYQLLARTLNKHDFADEAVEAYRKALELAPEDVETRLALSRLLLSREDRPEGQATLGALLEGPEAGAPLFLEAATLYEKAGMEDEVLRTLEQGAQRDDTNYEIQRRLAEIYHRGKEYPKAADAYYRAIDCASNLDDKLALNKHLINLYMTHMPRWPYEEDGKKVKLAPLYVLGEDYRQRMLKHPNELDVYMLFGQVNEAAYYNPLIKPFRLYRYRAKQTYEDVMDRDPLYLDAYFHKARRHLLDDEFEEAVLEYKKLLVINPVNKWRYYKEIGDLFAGMGYMNQAFRFWTKVDVRSFSEPDLLYQLACRYFRAEKTEDAIRILRKAIGINPNNYKYHLTLGNMHDHQEQYEDAIDEFRRTLALSTSDMLLPIRKRMSEVQTSQAKRLFSSGRLEEALAYFREIRDFQEILNKRLTEIDPQYPDTLVQIARCLERLGKDAEADSIYKEAVGKYFEHEAWVTDRVTMAIPYLLRLKTSRKYQSGGQMPAPAEKRDLRLSLKLVGQNRVVDSLQYCHIGANGIVLDGLDHRWVVDVNDVAKPPTKRETFHRYKRRIATFDNLTLIVTKSEKPDRKGDQFDILRAYDRAGEQKWSYCPEKWDINIREVRRVDDVLILNQGHHGVEALDAATGKPIWPVGVAAGGGGCRGLHTDGTRLCIKHFKQRKTSEMHFMLTEVKQRKVLWERSMGKDRLWLTPLVLGDVVVGLDDFNHEMQALSVQDGSLLYRYHFDSIFPRDPLTDGEFLYVHERNMEQQLINLYCIEPATGETRWITQLRMPSIHRLPVLHQGRFLYIDNYGKRMVGVDLRDGSICMDFDLLACIPKYVFEESIITFQTHAARVFLVTNKGRIYVFGIVKRET